MTATRGNIVLKLADRWVGVPLVAAFAVQPKRPRLAPGQVRRIGLLKTAAIGDTLLLAGLLDDIRRTFPAATLVMISGRDNAAAARLLPDSADEHIVISPASPITAIRSIRAARLDVLIDFGAWPRFDALLAATSGAAMRVGFRTAGQHRHFGYDVAVAHSRDVHERENYRRLLSALDVRSTSVACITPPGSLASDRYPARPYAVFHAWSSGYLHEVKEWPTGRWAALGCELARRGLTIVLTGAPSEKDATASLARALHDAGVPAVDAGGAFDLAELADVMAASEVVVSVNTGVMHLAAELGARTVSLEGPTPIARWGPVGPRTRAVASTFSNCGYLNLGFEYDGHRRDCMHGITVDMVLEAIDELQSDASS